jgi:hypothetical protein
MPKRVLAATTGIVAVLAGLIGCVFAARSTLDFLKHLTEFSWWDAFAAFASLLIWVIALSASWSGIRFLRFAWSGRSSPITSWLRSIVVGVLFFFPGFMFSLPITILWAEYTWPGDGQSWFAAMMVSFYIGIAAAILCCIVLLLRSRRDAPSPKSQ